MTIAQAKKIKITDFLNIQSDKNEFFIKSIFRQEKTPSFKINQSKNVFFDFGIGRGGTIVDLVCMLHNCTVKEALKILEKSDYNTANNTKIEITSTKAKTDIEIKKIQTIQNKALIDYLHTRKINLLVAREYLKEIYYTINNKNYFALCFENDSKGYECRNKYTKMCINKKDITTIQKNDNVLNLFEGFFDFLSALQYFKKNNNTTIILNSLSFLHKVDFTKYNKINLFLDNDDAGLRATQEIREKYQNKDIKDCSFIYKNYKDFNEYIKHLKV